MRIWKKAISVESLATSHDDTAVAHLGIEFLEVGDDFIRGRVPVDTRTRQPYGLLHGGVSVVLAETLGSVAALLNAPEGSGAVGVDLNITHHRSARGPAVTGVCVPLHLGRTVAAFDIVITDERGKRVCTSRITCALLDAPQG